jgi:hypothetical protein
MRSISLPVDARASMATSNGNNGAHHFASVRCPAKYMSQKASSYNLSHLISVDDILVEILLPT